MKKVAFVIATLSNGGAERAVSNIVTHLPADYEIDIILNDTNKISYPYKGNIVSLGMKPKENKVDLWYQLKVLIVRTITLRRLKKEKKYEAVLSFADSANVANILSGNRYGKVVVSVRNNLSGSTKSKAYKYVVNPLARLLYNRADKVVAVSKVIEKDLVQNFGIKSEKVTTIYNGFDSNIIQSRMEEPLSEKQETWVDSDFTIATVGRMTYQKGQWHLIRALTKLKEEGLNFKCLIMGDGELEPYLKKVVSQFKLEDNIIFCGFTENPFKILKQAHLFVMTSLYEGFTNALGEAMCCGLPCVVTDFKSSAREIIAPDMSLELPPISEVLEEKYGIITPVCSGKQYESMEELEPAEEKLAEAIKKMMENPKLCSYYRQQSEIRGTMLDINAAVDKWIAVINEKKIQI